jgi:single-strand DNA-binding protein
MPTLNRVQLIGRLGKDPESRYTPTGKQVTTFSLAVSNRWKSQGKPRKTPSGSTWKPGAAWARFARNT